MIQMLKLIFILLTLVFPGQADAAEAAESTEITVAEKVTAEEPLPGHPPYTEATLVFDRLGLLEEELRYDAFELAYTGYRKITDRSKDILTLIDYSRSSARERMYVIDMETKKVLFKTHVAHGRNSGDEYATSFSNVNGSYKSSPGFFLTDQTYHGKSGYSLRLEGLEKGINDKARDRAIVMHASKYADPKVAAARGKLGRSLGCPALPPKVTKDVIDTIKEGSVVFIYPGHDSYASISPLLSGSKGS